MLASARHVLREAGCIGPQDKHVHSRVWEGEGKDDVIQSICFVNGALAVVPGLHDRHGFSDEDVSQLFFPLPLRYVALRWHYAPRFRVVPFCGVSVCW